MSEREPISNIPLWMVPAIAVSLCAGAGIIAAAYVLMVQCAGWLKTGQWDPLPADWAWNAVGMHLPVTGMVGAERVVEWLVWVASPAPLAVTALIAGLLPALVLMLALTMANALAQDIAMHRERRAQRRR